MLIKTYSSMFSILLITGTVIACSSNSWITCWLGLEINLMSLIPLILLKLNFKTTETAIKYFLPQALASFVIIAMSVTYGMVESPLNLNNPSTILNLALAMKMGGAPLHFWFPQVMLLMEWPLCIITSTWQKVAPFILLSNTSFSFIYILLILTSGLVGSLGGLNQSNLKIIITYSSIAHIGWMLAALTHSLMTWLVYFIIYCVISIPLMMFFSALSLNETSEIFVNNNSSATKLMFTLNVLSLGGLPPFLGFSAKIFTIMMTIQVIPTFVILTLIASSLISLFYYSKMFFTLILNSTPLQKSNISPKTPNRSSFMAVSLLSNLLAPLLTLFIY